MCTNIYVQKFSLQHCKSENLKLPSYPAEGNWLKKSSTCTLGNPKLAKKIKAKLKYGYEKTFKTYC